jgi:hypothetical protein
MTDKKITRALDRRQFLKGAAGAAVALPVIAPASVFGAAAPSNRITIGCIGVGGKGSGNMRSFHGNRESQVVAVCDVDAAHRERACKSVGLDAKSSYNDFLDLLARDDIDAVSIATPDHWHVPTSIAAVRAGKDVYCEKPLTLTIAEGRSLPTRSNATVGSFRPALSSGPAASFARPANWLSTAV